MQIAHFRSQFMVDLFSFNTEPTSIHETFIYEKIDIKIVSQFCMIGRQFDYAKIYLWTKFISWQINK